jgi:diadenylate cyclase
MTSTLYVVWDAFRRAPWVSTIDILLVALGIYYLLALLQRTRAIQLMKGLAVLGVAVLVSNALHLTTVNWLLQTLLLPGVIVLVILFQPELRLALEQIGRGALSPTPLGSIRGEDVTQLVNELVRAARRCSRDRMGALMVLERKVGLNDIIQTGREINATVSTDLLRALFFPGSPLHDGAVVIRGDLVIAAGCLLPLTDRDIVGMTLGTRHRAALGLTERTDAVVIVVSEETGAVSLAHAGELISNLSNDALKQRLLNVLHPSDREGHSWFGRRGHAAPTSRT